MSNNELPFGILLLVLFGMAGALLLFMTRHHSQSIQFQLQLFVIALVTRFAASVAIYEFGLVNVLGDEDASGWALGIYWQQEWIQQQVNLLDLPSVLTTAFEGHHRGYGYMLGALFYITGVPGRMPAAALNCFFGALTAVFAYRIARTLFSEWVAVRVGWVTCFFPSMIIWSAQTVKEPIVILLETIALYGCVRLRVSGFSYKHITLCGLAILLMIPFRFYAAYIAGAAVVLTLTLPDFTKRKLSIASALAVVGMVVPILILSGVLVRHEALFEEFDMNRIERFRRNVSEGTGAGSGIKTTIDLDTPGGLTLGVAVGAAHVLLAPFPWQMGGASLRMLLTLPELLVWWWLFFMGVLPGLWYAIRNRFGEIQPVLIFTLGLGLLYSLVFGNVGLAFRHRAQLLPWLLILAMVGLERRRLKRLASQEMSRYAAPGPQVRMPDEPRLAQNPGRFAR